MASGMDIGSFTGSNFKGEEAIKKIMEAQAKGKIPMENEKFRLQMQKQAWIGLQKKLTDLNTATRDFLSPAYSAFRKIKADSSAPNILSISTDGIDATTLSPATYSIIPKQMATGDHFKSDVLSQDTLNPANFNIIYQGKSYPIIFAGGRLEDLTTKINNVGKDFLNAQTINSDGGSYLDIEAKEIGAKNKISFSGDTDFLKKIGLIRNALPSYYNLELLKPIGLSGSKEIPDLLMNDLLQLKPDDSATKALNTVQNIDSETQVWIYLKHPLISSKDAKVAKDLAKQKALEEKTKAITGFKDKIWVGDVNLMGGELLSLLKPLKPENKEEKEKKAQKDLQANKENPNALVTITLNYIDGKTLNSQAYFDVTTDGIQVIKSNVPKGKISSITIKNNSIFDIQISKGELIIFNRNLFDNKNSISKAQNAILHYRDTDYERDSNTITDIIPGKIQISGEQDNPVNLSIGFDYDEILEQLKNWVIAYNNTMDFIRNVGEDNSSSKSLLNRDRKKEIKEKREAYEKLSAEDKEAMKPNGQLFEGFLNADSSLNMIKTKLQSFIPKPYDTDAKEKVRFLKQMGIGIPNAGEIINMSEEDKVNYRAGYLDFTANAQKEFLVLLKEEFKSVQQFFFKRTNNSQLYNEGMFVDYNNTLNMYLQKYVNKLPGFFPSKDQLLNSQIQAQDKKIEQLDDKMKREEDKLRVDFSKVYQAQNKSKALGNQFSRFGRGE